MKNNSDTQMLNWLLDEYSQNDQFNNTFNDYEYLNKKSNNENFEFKDFIAFDESKMNNLCGITNDDNFNKKNNNFDSSFDYIVEQKKSAKTHKDISKKSNINLYNILSQKIKFDSLTNYKDILEYSGIIDSIDNVNGKFIATLTNINDKNDILIAEFNISEISYNSDKSLLDVGVNFLWVIGIECQINRKNGKITEGTNQHFSEIIIRRKQNLSKKKIKMAEDEANEWTEFFRKCTPTKKSGK